MPLGRSSRSASGPTLMALFWRRSTRIQETQPAMAQMPWASGQRAGRVAKACDTKGVPGGFHRLQGVAIGQGEAIAVLQRNVPPG
jgi:hypothetical protein